MSEPRASEPKKKTITEYVFAFVGGAETVIALEPTDAEPLIDTGRTLFRLKGRMVTVLHHNLLWAEVRQFQVPVKEPAGPPQVQPSLL